MFGRTVSVFGRALAAAASTASGGSAPQILGVVPRALSQQLIPRSFSLEKSFATNSVDIFNQHVSTPENDSPFSWQEKTLKKAQEIIGNYPPNYKASAVIPCLDLAQQQNHGHLSLSAMNAVAALLDMPEIRVYEVATFYSMYNRSRIGKYQVMVCGTTPCRLQGAQKIQESLEKHLGIHIGDTTKDGMFTLTEMECMGACVNAPMIAVADFSGGLEKYKYDYFEDLTPQDTVNIIETIRKGQWPKVGSQHRSKAEPSGCVTDGKWIPSGSQTTLTTPPRGPYAPNLDL